MLLGFGGTNTFSLWVAAGIHAIPDGIPNKFAGLLYGGSLQNTLQGAWALPHASNWPNYASIKC